MSTCPERAACPDCAVRVEGDWTRCPLCGAELGGGGAPGPWPVVPLRFSRRRVLRVLALASLAVIVLSFLAQLLFRPEDEGIGALRSIWLGIATTWLVVLMAIGKRRNVAKAVVYLVAAAGAVSVYWDYLTDFSGWSLTYVVPIVCAASIIGLLLTVRLIRMAAADHIVYTGLVVLLGLMPLLFLALGWVGTWIPSAICGALSAIAVVLLLTVGGGAMRHELAQRLHL